MASHKTPVGKAASDLAIHPTVHFPEFEHREKPRHVDYTLNVIHKHKSKGGSVSSATDTVASEMSELYELRQALKTSWKKQNQPKTELMNHIKREPFYFRQYIPYNVEFPHRVAVHMQRLMATTKVHLNDPGFVSHLQEKLTDEENTEVMRNAHRRAKMEFDRVKRLIIDGTVDSTTIPPDLQSLTSHPAYIVKQMLNRLDEYDKKPHIVPKPKTKIVQVEPFEYNGKKFFRHLHSTGGKMDWMPKRVRKARRKSLKVNNPKGVNVVSGDKRAGAQTLQTLYKRPMSLDSDAESTVDLLGVQERNTESGETGTNPPTAAFEFPDENALKHFLQEQIISDAIAQKKRADERRRQDIMKEKLYLEQRKKRMQWRKDLIPGHGELLYDLENRSSPKTISADTSFDRLRKRFGVPGTLDTYQHKMPEDDRILKYIDEAEDANELFGNSEALDRLYAREARFVDTFLPTLQRQLAFDSAM